MVLEGQQEAGARNQMLLLRWKVIAMATLTKHKTKKEVTSLSPPPLF